ncbi:DUF2339 domain-containing protein [Serratia aquatilis]|uniref:DUF2339 domain-containing protein n=1 Tax=Serratia aquatilis TaxID=1737515 RepID=A0ABV6EGT9_9GAMM
MEGLVLLAGLALLLCLVVLPILVVVSLGRGSRNQREITQLTHTITQLQQQVDSLMASKAELPQVASVAEAQPLAAVERVDNLIQRPSVSTNDNPVEPPPVVVLPEMFTSTEPKTPAAWPPASDSPKSAKNELFSGLFTWFMQGNPLAKLGILLLFFGLAYLLKYTVERDMLPIEFRLIGAAAVSGILLWFGWRLRLKQTLYALILQGGAVGALYITVFGAFRLYQLLPHLLAFGLMLVICAASVGLAVLQRALSLAMLASLGGYLSPLLLSSGGGSHIALFSYYLLLSLGILAVSIWQPWRPLNLLGFIFSFGVAGLWGAENYQQEYYLSCQLFLIANMVIFGVLCLALTLRARLPGEKIIDGTLLFGPPLIGFGMQYLITQQWEFGPAFSALGFGLAYLLLAWLALKRYPALGKTLSVSGLALGGVFTTLAIPLALSAQWTSMAWALEGVGILWLGRTQQQIRMSLSGSGLLVLALASAVVAQDMGMTTLSFTLVFAILALSWLTVAFLWRDLATSPNLRLTVSRAFLAGGIFLWLVCLMGFTSRLDLAADRAAFLALLLLTLSVVLWRKGAQRLAWPELGYSIWLLWPGMLAMLLFQLSTFDTLLAAGWLDLLWLPVLCVAYWMLKRDAAQLRLLRLEQGLHLSLFWMVLLALGYEVYWRTTRLPWGMDEWQLGLQMGFIALVILVTQHALRKRYWPFAAHRQLYGAIAMAPLAALVLFLLLMGNLLDGISMGWQYLPLINPLEEGAGFALLALITLGRFVRGEYPQYSPWLKRALPLLTMVILFWWGNGALLRALAYYADIPWRADALWDSRLVQTTFALTWMLVALIIMVWSTRQRRREAWFGGAALLGIVIIKLMLVDSARGGGLARAISFIGVAILVLIVGYFSPLPPKTERGKEPNMESERGDV